MMLLDEEKHNCIYPTQPFVFHALSELVSKALKLLPWFIHAGIHLAPIKRLWIVHCLTPIKLMRYDGWRPNLSLSDILDAGFWEVKSARFFSESAIEDFGPG